MPFLCRSRRFRSARFPSSRQAFRPSCAEAHLGLLPAQYGPYPPSNACFRSEAVTDFNCARGTPRCATPPRFRTRPLPELGHPLRLLRGSRRCGPFPRLNSSDAVLSLRRHPNDPGQSNAPTLGPRIRTRPLLFSGPLITDHKGRNSPSALGVSTRKGVQHFKTLQNIRRVAMAIYQTGG